MEKIYKFFEKLYVKLDEREEKRLLETYDKTNLKYIFKIQQIILDI